MRNLTSWALLGMMLLLVGCAPMRTKTPLTACPLVQKTAVVDNGSIFQSAAIRPMFEDRHARNVGDELTINIGEVTTQTEKSSKNEGKSSGLNVDLPSKADKSGGSNDKANSNAFTGGIIATVIVVMDNGKLLVCGDKLVKYANGDTNFEYVRFTGVVNPSTISTNNTVLSTQVADVQIEYRNANNIDSPSAPPTLFSRLSTFFAPKKLYF